MTHHIYSTGILIVIKVVSSKKVGRSGVLTALGTWSADGHSFVSC
jgi:hypothetical protein